MWPVVMMKKKDLISRKCQIQKERKKHISNTFVRWTELLRLPYFNPIQYCVINPMHNLFLEIANWIIKKLWINGGKISNDDLELMEKRFKAIKILADLGQIPNKIATGEGFSGFTADQWKSFIL
ncbi:15904_t:CDS:2, partial [Funneliformis caledonium]